MEENENEQENKQEPQESQNTKKEEDTRRKRKSRRKVKKNSISLEPCPHRAIKWELKDRDAMTQAEYDAYLATPKWIGKAWYREEKEVKVKRRPVRRRPMIRYVESDEPYRPCKLPKVDKLPRINLSKEFMLIVRLLLEASVRVGQKKKKKWWKTIRWNGKDESAEKLTPDETNPEKSPQNEKPEGESALPQPVEMNVDDPTGETPV